MHQPKNPPLARLAREAVAAGDLSRAEDLLAELIEDVTGRTVTAVGINSDQYSLNSINGAATFDDGTRLFYKYHQEEGEESTLQEYYNAELLDRAGFAVDLPLHACGEPGRQILLYRMHTEPRFAEVCRRLDDRSAGDPELTGILDVQRRSDRDQVRAMLASVRPASVVPREHLLEQPIHQLFHHRLTSGPHREGFGGRVREYYVGAEFHLAKCNLNWSELADCAWTVNGAPLGLTLRQAFAMTARRLAPRPAGGVVVAHGDDHNANIWYSPAPGGHRLVLFDPAFAGDAVPALLAPVKSTFHNVFAHPLWLYEPQEATHRYHVTVRHHPGEVKVDLDFALTPLREGILDSKLTNVWAPLLRELATRGLLADDWSHVMNLALFSCPMLVRNLVGSDHTPMTAALGIGIAMSLAADMPVPGVTDRLRAWQGKMRAEVCR